MLVVPKNTIGALSLAVSAQAALLCQAANGEESLHIFECTVAALAYEVSVSSDTGSATTRQSRSSKHLDCKASAADPSIPELPLMIRRELNQSGKHPPCGSRFLMFRDDFKAAQGGELLYQSKREYAKPEGARLAELEKPGAEFTDLERETLVMAIGSEELDFVVEHDKHQQKLKPIRPFYYEVTVTDVAWQLTGSCKLHIRAFKS